MLALVIRQLARGGDVIRVLRRNQFVVEVAIARILLPKANLPATTSLGVLDTKQKNNIFSCGANVIMRKVTPPEYVQLYEIYPTAIKVNNIEEERQELEATIRSLGKIPR